MIPRVADIHTHNREATDAVINLEPGMEPEPGRLYSAGWHPWWGAEADMAWVEAMARRPEVVMIGECGIDKQRGAGTLSQQLDNTRRQALLAERTGKPLLLHIVGAWNEIIALRRELRPSVEWIIHGFRGKPELARQLVNAGFHISLGSRFNPLAESAIPPERLLRESDADGN